MLLFLEKLYPQLLLIREWFYQEFFKFFKIFSDGTTRWHWIYFIAFFFTAGISFLLYRQERIGFISFFRYCFPKKVYLHPSSRMDYKIFFLNHFWAALWKGQMIFSVPFIVVKVVPLLTETFGPSRVQFTWNSFTIPLITFLVIFVSDFAGYLVHALHHFCPVLWPIHRLHHSAEVLQPATTMRDHPLYELIAESARVLLRGLLQGILFYVMVGKPEFIKVFGINAFYFAFNIAGAHLRHSNLWLSYGFVIGHIIISPAQHQIHHSSAPEHRNKNIGEIFAIWDWMFGTLYIPKSKEDLVFGVEKGMPQLHPTLWKAYTEPLVSSGKAFLNLFKR